MRYKKSLSIIILFFTVGLFTQLRPAEAACNFHQLMTSATKDVSNFTSTCTITGVEGVDNPQNSETSTTTNASLALGTNSAITINNGGTLAVNSLSITAGTIAIQTGGQIKFNTPLYVADADADGYPVDFTLYTASASGRRRLGLMRSFATADCGDSTYSTANSCCTVATRYQDADADGYGNPAVSISACTTAGYVDNNTDCNDGSALVFTSHAQCYTDADGDTYTTGLAANTTCLNTVSCATATKASASTTGAAVTTYTAGRLRNAAVGSDCNETGTNAANVYISATCYVDSDNDNYGSATSKSCTNNATCTSATWASGGAGTAAASGNFAANASDCYEGNASAYPGSGACGGNRGDGSFDWNCDGGQSGCGTGYYSLVDYGIGWIVDENTCGTNMAGEPKCCQGDSIVYTGSGVGCGGGGYAQGQYYSNDTCGCGCGRVYGYLPGGYGTQACQ